MSAQGHGRAWIGVGGALAFAAAAAAAERRHLQRVARDPRQELLREPPRGAALSIHSADGTELHAEVFGSPDASTIVLAHGWTESLTYWTLVIRELTARGLRVVAYDLRGHGESARAEAGDYSLARFGEDLEAVLAACLDDGTRATVAGHSLGAMSIAAWAERHDVQQRVSAAALLNTGVGDLIAEHLLVPVPALAYALNRLLSPTALLSSRAAVPGFSTPLSHAMIRYVAFGSEATPAGVAFYERMLVACPPDVRADVGLALSEMDLYHALPRLTVPTVVLAGAQDRLTPPAHAQRIAAALPDVSQVIVLPRTGHMGPLERPREISEMLAGLAREGMSGTRGARDRAA
jgi:pimeloyl-ACP methyl ester carboxylesterase